jgi:uncharacterized protein (DUF736 family)
MATQPKGNNPWDDKEVGVIWKKKSKTKGEAYLSVVVNVEKLLAAGYTKDAQLIAFVNKNKQKDTHPDLRIYVSERREGTGKPAAPAKTAVRTAPTAPVAPEPAVEENELI